MDPSHLRELEETLLGLPRTPWNENLSQSDMLALLYENNCQVAQQVLNNYEAAEKLGEGTYGLVFRAIHRRSREVVALKRIRFESTDEGTPSTAIREVALLRILKHPNIVSLLEIAHEEKSLILVFEFMDQDLHNYIEANPQGIDDHTIASFLYQLLTGLRHCHQNRIYHRDLKPQNLLINFKGELKLADFGLARSGSIHINAMTHEVVTLWYRPPDVILGNTKYTEGIDMWGVGCIFAEMFVGRPVFAGNNPLEQLIRVFRTCGGPNHPSNTLWDPTRFKLWPEYEQKLLMDPKGREALYSPANLRHYMKRMSPLAYDLLVRFLQYDESARISCDEALSHPYFIKIQQDEEEQNPLAHHLANNKETMGSLMLPTYLDQYGTQYYNLQYLDPDWSPNNPSYMTESNSQGELDDDLQQLQEHFDVESRALEAKRAIGRVAREYHTLLKYETDAQEHLQLETPYHQFTFNSLDFDYPSRLRPEDFLVRYANENHGYIQTPFVDILQDHAIGSLLDHYQEFALNYPCIDGMTTGCADRFPVNGDEEYQYRQYHNLVTQQHQLDLQVSQQLGRPPPPPPQFNFQGEITPYQQLASDADAFSSQLNDEYLYIEENWRIFRERVVAIDSDVRDLLISLLPTIHQNVTRENYPVNDKLATSPSVARRHAVITEDQLNWLVYQSTNGAMTTSFDSNIAKTKPPTVISNGNHNAGDKRGQYDSHIRKAQARFHQARLQYQQHFSPLQHIPSHMVQQFKGHQQPQQQQQQPTQQQQPQQYQQQ